MAEFRNPVVFHYIDIWHLLNSNLILIFVTFLNSDLLWLDYEFHLTDYKLKAEDGLDLTLYPYMCRPNMYKFVDLLNVENPTIIKRLVVYIYKAFELRSNYNYNQWDRHLVIISKWLFDNFFNTPSLNNGICNHILYNKC